MRQMIRRFAVGAFGLAALLLATVGVAPQSVGAADAFTQVGCQINDYNCLFARNNVNPNAVQIDYSRFRSGDFGYYGPGYNPYFYGIGYNTAQFGYGYNPYFYGYGIGAGQNFNGNGIFYYNNTNGQFVYSPGITRSTNPNDGYCNLGYGERGCVSARR